MSDVPRSRCRREATNCFPAYLVLNKRIPSSTSHESGRPRKEIYRGLIDLSSLAFVAAGYQDGFEGNSDVSRFISKLSYVHAFFSVHVLHFGLLGWAHECTIRTGHLAGEDVRNEVQYHGILVAKQTVPFCGVVFCRRSPLAPAILPSFEQLWPPKEAG